MEDCVTEERQTRTEASKKPSEDLLLKLLDDDNDEQELVPSLWPSFGRVIIVWPQATGFWVTKRWVGHQGPETKHNVFYFFHPDILSVLPLLVLGLGGFVGCLTIWSQDKYYVKRHTQEGQHCSVFFHQNESNMAAHHISVGSLAIRYEWLKCDNVNDESKDEGHHQMFVNRYSMAL